MTLLAVDAAEVFRWIGYILVAMICFMFMIVVHELGHSVPRSSSIKTKRRERSFP